MISQASWAASLEKPPKRTTVGFKTYSQVENAGACYEEALRQWEFRRLEMNCSEVVPELVFPAPCEEVLASFKNKTVIIHQVQEFLKSTCFSELNGPIVRAKEWISLREEQSKQVLLFYYGLFFIGGILTIIVWRMLKRKKKN